MYRAIFPSGTWQDFASWADYLDRCPYIKHELVELVFYADLQEWRESPLTSL